MDGNTADPTAFFDHQDRSSQFRCLNGCPTPRRAAMGERFFAVRRLDGGGRSAFLRGYRIGRRLPMNQADADEPGGPGIGSAVSTDTTLAAAEIGCVARRREHRRPPEN